MLSIGSIIVPILVISTLLAATSTAGDTRGYQSMIAQYDFETSPDILNYDINYVDLILSKDEIITKPFAKLLAKLTRSNKSLCDVEAELRLVNVCRSVQVTAGEDVSTSEVLDSIRSLYGIRKAICETRVSNFQVPSPCKTLVPTSHSRLTQKAMARSELELASSDNIAMCLQKFQEHHYFWTSYSNNRQEAGDIIHLLRSEVEMHNMILTYRDFESSINGLNSDLDKIRKGATEWYDEAAQQIQDLFDHQSAALQNFESGVGNVSSSILQTLKTVNKMAEANDLFVRTMSTAAVDGISNIVENTALVNHAIAKMKTTMADIYSSAALEVATFTQSHLDGMEKVVEMFTNRSLSITTGLEEIESHFVRMNTLVEHFNEIQSISLDKAEAQHLLADQILSKQRAAVEVLDYALDVVERLSTETQHLGATVTMITYVVGMIHEYEPVLVAVLLYIAICLVLSPLNGVVVSPKAVSDIKSVYWAGQASFFLIRQFDLANMRNHTKDLQNLLIRIFAQPLSCLWFTIGVIAAIAAATVTVLICCLCGERNTIQSCDVEQARLTSANAKLAQRRMCSSQLQRLGSVPRSFRHGTAPPGL